MRFEGRVALVTGAAAGIGRACALLFARDGADVILMDVNREKLEAVKLEIEGTGRRALSYVTDISDEAAVKASVADAISKLGKIDILVNNAAIWRTHSNFSETSSETWRKFLDINVMGTVYVTQAALPSMLAQKYGRIINVASVAGVFGIRTMAHYSASKAAVIAMSRALAKEVVNDGILVNAVSPGSVSPGEIEDIDFVKESNLPYMGRTGSDRENANLILFLASDEASYISGQNIQIDGCRRQL
jgi:NAD(P)-dependent dehydrogenase (short-subunit alcohol dehydrogenase family)